jgi:hypothetical protein
MARGKSSRAAACMRSLNLEIATLPIPPIFDFKAHHNALLHNFTAAVAHFHPTVP